MTDPAKYWPGGIPAHVLCHDEPIEEGLDEECKGWQLFLEENVEGRGPSNDDADFEVNQRRKLVERWATLEQAERDAYQDRAPNRGQDGWYPEALKGDLRRSLKRYGFCNLLVPQPMSSRNRALWAKMRIMMYRLDGSGEGLSFEDICTIEPNGEGPIPVTPQDFYRWLWVEAALFDHMAMTSQGTVIFHNWDSDTFFANQDALDTGRLLLCHFENNGSVEEDLRVPPLYTYHAFCRIEGLGHDLHTIMVDDDPLLINDDANEELDMEQPILDLLKSKKQYIELFEGDTSEEQWRRDIERYAPGYLDAEAQGKGMALDYEHGNFKTSDEL
ncbi:hypothetical protein G7054_g6620 [Neopestalotiopsis clavispora]|nr:hypothetical protein G7054_g6620 [Neopestalotiopsis clavispora]